MRERLRHQEDSSAEPRHRLRRGVAATSAGVLAIGGAGAGAVLAIGASPASGSATPSPAAVAKKVDPGLVDVTTDIDFGVATGKATGMVLSSRGEVLTNNHVVEGASSIRVTDIGNGKSYSATVLGYDMARDVALIQLKGASGLPTVKLGNSAAVTVGEPVVGIGNANGAGGTPSAVAGSILATNKSLVASDSLTGATEQLSGMLETDARIVEGDSGGPLVDDSGAVIGMDTAGSSTFRLAGSSSASEGFAVPVDAAVAVAHQIESKSSSATVHVGPTAFLGVEVETVGSLGSTAVGVGIAQVVAGSPAARAGLVAGEVITSVGGHSVSSTSALTTVMVRDEKPGERTAVRYLDQSGNSHSVNVTLSSGPAQ